MNNKYITLLAAIFLTMLNCNRNPYIVDFSNVDSTEKEIIVDLSKAVQFSSKSNKPIISDSEYLNEFIEYLISSKRNCELLINSKHEDRFYLETQQSNVVELKNMLTQKGVNSSQLSAKLGLDFKDRFPEKINSSNLIAILK